MDIREFTADDAETVQAVVELLNAARKVDAPFAHPVTPAGYVGMIRYGWDGEPPRPYAVRDGGALVGLVDISVSEWDNTHLAWASITVHPDLRRRGYGSALLDFTKEQARTLGRTSLGIDGWDIEAANGFAARHELPRKGAAINRRQTLADVDVTALAEMYDEARSAASSYELLRFTGHTPDETLQAVAEMTAAINDAPTDDLDIEDEVFPPERIMAYENAQEARGNRLYRVVARHRDTGELAGHSVVAVESERPWIGDQHDTSVVRSHRGHRLGLLLKADMMHWLADVEPGLTTIDTWNMESNDHMIAVNERLGYRALAREYAYQLDI
jgi:GNAT superfamily N-acetyltransferase